MGCDINIVAEKLVNEKYEYVPTEDLFENRSYGVFGFLAGVRNYSAIPPISLPRGIPDDATFQAKMSLEDCIYFGHSWLTTKELVEYDYDQIIEDRRTTFEIAPNCFDHAHTCEVGQGKKMKLKYFLRKGFFEDVKSLQDMGIDRIVFWFDN